VPSKVDLPLRVLIVEDLPLSAVLAKQVLDEVAKTECEIVHTLAECLSRLRSPGIDVVLLDLGLPDAKGVEAVEGIQHEAPHVPIVVLSGDQTLLGPALLAGAQEFVAKPADGPRLALALTAAIARHKVRSTFAPVMRRVEKLEQTLAESEKFDRKGEGPCTPS
jgi:DNA-binding NarL/FixJ family response regulator